MDAAWARLGARKRIESFGAASGIRVCAVLACATLVTACSLPLEIEDTRPPEIVIPPDDGPGADALTAVTVPDSAARRTFVPRPRTVALLVSSSVPAFEQVAYHLRDLIGPEHTAIHLLDGDAESRDSAVSAINAAEPRATVAIGLDAALVASESIVSPVLFCQVFNYAEHEQLRSARAAVSVLPSFGDQLRIWQGLDDSLERIGAIAGPGHETLIAESRRSAEAAGVKLSYLVSDSDQETVYLFKRLAPEIDGFWLLPDNRVLSVTAIREILSYALQHGVQVLVSNRELLELGALMSMAPSPEEIAKSIHALLGDLGSLTGPNTRIVAPGGFDVTINANVANRFGLDLAGHETSIVRVE